MENDPALFDKIDAYLAGQLSPAETQTMEDAVADDPTLASEVALRRAEFEVSEAIIAGNIRRQMGELRKSEAASGRNGQNRKIWLLLLLVCAAAAGLWYSFRSKKNESPQLDQPLVPPKGETQNPDNQHFDSAPSPLPGAPPVKTEPPKYDKNYQPGKPPATPRQPIALAKEFYQKPDFSNFRASTPELTSQIGAAAEAFEKGDFGTALALTESVALTDPQFWKAQYIIAHGYFSMGDYEGSAIVFEKIIEKKIQPWAEESEWYYLLAALAAGKGKTAGFEQKLEKISADSEHPFSAVAQGLQKRMQK